MRGQDPDLPSGNWGDPGIPDPLLSPTGTDHVAAGGVLAPCIDAQSSPKSFLLPPSSSPWPPGLLNKGLLHPLDRTAPPTPDFGSLGSPFSSSGMGGSAQGWNWGGRSGFGGVAGPQGAPSITGDQGNTPPVQIWGVAETWDGNSAPQLQRLGRNSAPKSQGPSLRSRRWNGKGRGRGRSPCAPQVSPWGCLSSWDPGIPEGGGLGAPGSRGVTSVGSGERGSAGSRGVTGTGGWGDFGAEASGVCWIPKMLGQRLAPRGEGTEPPGRGCGVTGDLPGPSGDPGEADKGGGSASALGVPPSSCPQQDPWER